jgi:hypothetical protein
MIGKKKGEREREKKKKKKENIWVIPDLEEERRRRRFGLRKRKKEEEEERKRKEWDISAVFCDGCNGSETFCFVYCVYSDDAGQEKEKEKQQRPSCPQIHPPSSSYHLDCVYRLTPLAKKERKKKKKKKKKKILGYTQPRNQK